MKRVFNGVERQASLLLAKAYPSGITIPVDIDLIVETHPLVDDIIPARDLESRFQVCAALVVKDNGKIDIIIDDGSHCPVGRIRFSMAHELGHIELHKDLFRDCKTLVDTIRLQSEIKTKYKKFEREVNNFAGAILVPSGPLWVDLSHLYTQTVQQLQFSSKMISILLRKLANRYTVSLSAIEIRLNHLGWYAVIQDSFLKKLPDLALPSLM
jgi:hypothetical protein